ncbi:transposable element Tcb1 transposase [Trichonephila clavipes]|nr:transposable element Tcb1 transposase [Trichonephila clavipes]
MPNEKHRASFDQASEFDEGRIVAYRDCGLSFREIDQRVGHKQATVMKICPRWTQEETMNRHGLSHSPRRTTARCDSSGMSARRPLLRLPFSGNHRRLRRQWYNADIDNGMELHYVY